MFPKPQYTNTIQLYLIFTFNEASTLMESSTMNTRSRTRSGTTTTPKLQTSKNRMQKDRQHDVDNEGKERKEQATSNVKSKKSKKTLKSVLCFCSKDDDGSPMILCSECKIWYVYYWLILLFLVFTETKLGIISLVLMSVNRRQRKLVSIDLVSPLKKAFVSDLSFP